MNSLLVPTPLSSTLNKGDDSKTAKDKQNQLPGRTFDLNCVPHSKDAHLSSCQHQTQILAGSELDCPGQSPSVRSQMLQFFMTLKNYMTLWHLQAQLWMQNEQREFLFKNNNHLIPEPVAKSKIVGKSSGGATWSIRKPLPMTWLSSTLSPFCKLHNMPAVVPSTDLIKNSSEPLAANLGGEAIAKNAGLLFPILTCIERIRPITF